MYKYFFLVPFLFLLSCSSPPINMSEEEIDAYIESVVDTSNVYDIAQGLRYTKEDKSYRVTEFSRSDSTILFNTEETSETSTTKMNIFFKDGFPIYVEEYSWEYPEESYKAIERKIYLTGEDVLVAYERTADSDFEIDEKKFEEVELDYAGLDFKRPENAIDQKGEFEMKYGEFLIINPESYLILDNDKSGWGVALYILEGDMLLDELYDNPEKYKGKTINVQHEFMVMSGIERMIYRGGIVSEN